MAGTNAFIFTDNTTAGAYYHNRTSYSPELFELVVILRKLELYHGLKLHIIHVVETRMIEQVIDGLSQVNQLEGVLIGVKMLNFVPIHDSSLCKEPLLIDWIRTWTS